MRIKKETIMIGLMVLILGVLIVKYHQKDDLLAKTHSISFSRPINFQECVLAVSSKISSEPEKRRAWGKVKIDASQKMEVIRLFLEQRHNGIVRNSASEVVFNKNAAEYLFDWDAVDVLSDSIKVWGVAVSWTGGSQKTLQILSSRVLTEPLMVEEHRMKYLKSLKNSD